MASSTAALTTHRGKTTKAKLPTPEAFKKAADFYVRTAKELDSQERYFSKVKAEEKGKKGEVQQKRVNAYDLSGELGRPVDKNLIKRLKTANYKQLKSLATVYRRAYGKIPEDRVGTVNSAFNAPLVLTDPLRNFIQRANFGTLPAQLGGAPVADALRLTSQDPASNGAYLSNRAILSTLFALYAKSHALYRNSIENSGKPEDRMNHQVIGADQTMNETLGPLFDRLEQADAQGMVDKKTGRVVRDGEQRPQNKRGTRKYVDEFGQRIWADHYHAFNRRNFSYSAFQKLFSAGGIIDKKAAGGSAVAGINLAGYDIPKEQGVLYMRELKKLKSESATGKLPANFLFTSLAQQAAAAAGQPLSAGLDKRAQLDTVHAIVAAAGSQYASAVKKQRKPRAKKVVQ